MTSRIVLAVSGLVLVGAAGMGFILHENWIYLPWVESSEASYPAGITDDRVFVGMSHNIFVAKILKKTGQTNGIKAPRTTQFDMQIVKNVKGSLSGVVNISQEGGYDNGILMLVNGQPLLETGKTYLLSVRTDGKGMYLVSSYSRGAIMIFSDQSLSLEQLMTNADTQSDVLALTAAYQAEIPYQPDIQSQTNFNNYSSTITK